MSVRNVLDTLFGIIPLLDRIKVSIEESSGAIPEGINTAVQRHAGDGDLRPWRS